MPNQYRMLSGYTGENVFNGYGITMDTIKYWLFEHDLNTKPTKLIQMFNMKHPDKLHDENYYSCFNELTLHSNLEYFIADQYQICGFIYQYPQLAENQTVKIPSADNITNQIVNLIFLTFDIPLKLRPAFETYLKDHINEISCVDSY